MIRTYYQLYLRQIILSSMLMLQICACMTDDSVTAISCHYHYHDHTETLFITVYIYVQGAENDIRAKFYSLAFKQEYIEEESAVAWKIIDFMFVGDIPYMQCDALGYLKLMSCRSVID